jgi:hypothetical protein
MAEIWRLVGGGGSAEALGGEVEPAEGLEVLPYAVHPGAGVRRRAGRLDPVGRKLLGLAEMLIEHRLVRSDVVTGIAHLPGRGFVAHVTQS